MLTSTKVVNVVETSRGVEITDGNGRTELFDAAVLATHPGQSLAMLGEPTAAQREILGGFPYSANQAQLHTDTSLLPDSDHVRASWNYLERPGSGQVTVTYDLTRLMRLPAPGGVRHLVTLGGADLIDPEKVIATMEYEHPLYTPESVAAQQQADELDRRAGLRRRLARLGVPRGRRPLRCPGGRSAGAVVDDPRGAARRRDRRVSHHDQPHPARPAAEPVRAPLPLAGGRPGPTARSRTPRPLRGT